MGLYERQRTGKLIFLIISISAIALFLIVSNNLVKQLAKQEQERMNIWAKATERLAKAEIDSDFEFLLHIIEQNNSIPVMVADSAFNVVEYRNFRLPDHQGVKGALVAPSELSEENRAYLVGRLKRLGGDTPLEEMARKDNHFIKVEVLDNTVQYIYYEDSILLRRLSLYPYVQLFVMAVLVLIIYFAVIYTKRAEQNRVWAGLSKETAHQLGTPISSLMAWSEYLQASGTDPMVVEEINKDVNRLSVIADRFSKIGSVPELKLEYLNQAVSYSLEYMRRRISDRVTLTMHLSDDDHGVMISKPLFEWVMENIVKNAVDAMGGRGYIDITTGSDKNNLFIEIRDTGKGIARKNFKTVFNPGDTTAGEAWLGPGADAREAHRGGLSRRQDLCQRLRAGHRHHLPHRPAESLICRAAARRSNGSARHEAPHLQLLIANC